PGPARRAGALCCQLAEAGLEEAAHADRIRLRPPPGAGLLREDQAVSHLRCRALPRRPGPDPGRRPAAPGQVRRGRGRPGRGPGPGSLAGDAGGQSAPVLARPPGQRDQRVLPGRGRRLPQGRALERVLVWPGGLGAGDVRGGSLPGPSGDAEELRHGHGPLEDHSHARRPACPAGTAAGLACRRSGAGGARRLQAGRRPGPVSGKIKLGLVGARGHVGSELIRLLAAHPRFELAFVGSRERAGQRLAEHEAAYAGELCYRNPDPATAATLGADAVVLALPNGLAAPYVQAFEERAPDTVLLDLS